MNIMGFNIQVPGEGLDLIGKHKPAASLLMDIKSEHVAEAKRLSPGTEIIFRKEDGKKWRDKDPVAWVQAMWFDVLNCPPDWVVLDNEPLGHDAVAEFVALDQWQRAAADWIHANTPMKVGMFSFPEGNFTKDGPNIAVHFPLSMQAADGAFIHEYWKPHLDSLGMEGYHCLRIDAWLKWFEDAGYPDMPIYVTECGITMAVNAQPHGDPSGPDVGYASEEAEAAGVTAETYLTDLQQYHWRCCQEPRIKAALPFIWKPYSGQWGSFVPTEEMTERMFSFDAPGSEPPEPEPPPNGGDEMTEILDFDGSQKDEQWLHNVWGVTIKRATPSAGQSCFRLVKVTIDEGPCAILNEVMDADDIPMENVLVAFHWPGAPSPPESGHPPYTTPVYTHDWKSNFVFGTTNIKGDWAGAMGKDAMINEGGEGPHWCWMHHEAYPSDGAAGLGWRTGTNHRAPRLFWQLMAGEGNGGGNMDDLVIVERVEEPHAAAMLYIAYPVSISFDTRGRAGSSAAADLDTTEPDSYEYDGRTFARVGVCADFEGDAPREYWIEAHDLPSGKAVTPRVTETFNPLPDRRKVTYVVDFAGEPIEPEPPPTPPEPSEDPAQRLRDLGDYVRDELYGIAAGLSSEVASGTLTLRMKSGNVQTFAVTPSASSVGLLARLVAGARGLMRK